MKRLICFLRGHQYWVVTPWNDAVLRAHCVRCGR